MTVWTRVQRDPVPIITAAFWLVALAWGLRGTVASDEGMLTWFSAALIHDAFSAGVFVQRFHPTLGLIYLPTVPFGWGAFVLAHATVAALGVFAAGRWTQRLGGHAALGALALALSPAYLYGAATGQSNTDGTALLLVGAALYDGATPRARFAGGLVLSLTVWARFELAPVVGALALFALWRSERRAALAGMLLWPAAYLAAGALYHRAGLWFLRYPPMEGSPAPGIREAFQLRVNLDGAQRVIFAWALVSGLWPLLLGGSLTRAGTARIVGGVTALLALAFTVSPFFGVNGPEVAPRYLAVALPAVVVVVGASGARAPGRWRVVAFALVALAAMTLGATSRPWTALHAAAVLSPLALLVMSRAAGAARAGWAVVAAALPLIALPFSRDVFARFESPEAPWREAEAVAARLRAEPAATVVTNLQSLVPQLHARGVTSARYLLAFDPAMAVAEVTNPHNGQLDAVARGFTRRYEVGGALWPCALAAHEFQRGDLVVLVSEWRTDIMTPMSIWASFTEPVERVGAATVLRVRQGPSRVRLPPPPPWAQRARLERLCGTREGARP